MQGEPFRRCHMIEAVCRVWSHRVARRKTVPFGLIPDDPPRHGSTKKQVRLCENNAAFRLWVALRPGALVRLVRDMLYFRPVHTDNNINAVPDATAAPSSFRSAMGKRYRLQTAGPLMGLAGMGMGTASMLDLRNVLELTLLAFLLVATGLALGYWVLWGVRTRLKATHLSSGASGKPATFH